MPNKRPNLYIPKALRHMPLFVSSPRASAMTYTPHCSNDRFNHQVGVKNIVLAVNYRADVMEKFLREYEEKVRLVMIGYATLTVR